MVSTREHCSRIKGKKQSAYDGLGFSPQVIHHLEVCERRHGRAAVEVLVSQIEAERVELLFAR